MLRVLYLAFFLYSASSFSAIEALDFDNNDQEQLYGKLTEELRCLVCQNQNIADSNAELALDLRDKTYRLIKEGKDESEVKQWMIDRYGDFVLYKPPFKKETLVLWIGPGVLFFIAMFVVVRIARKNGNNKEEIDQKQQQKIHDLMQSEEKQ